MDGNVQVFPGFCSNENSTSSSCHRRPSRPGADGKEKGHGVLGGRTEGPKRGSEDFPPVILGQK